MPESVSRTVLAQIIERAAETGRVPERSRARLQRVVETTEAVAVGWFHCDGVGCPARQAGYRSQRFQEAFDRAMFEHLGLAFDVTQDFVVRVTDPPLSPAGESS